MLIVGIDPGLSGALAFLDAAGGLTVTDVPVHVLKVNGRDRRRLDGHSLARCVANLASTVAGLHVILENVHAMPKQGVASSFSFGKVFGAIEQCLVDHNVPYTLVEPALWKRVLGVPADKDGARRRASQLMPKHAGLWARAKDDGRAEAALLAYYGSRIFAAKTLPEIFS